MCGLFGEGSETRVKLQVRDLCVLLLAGPVLRDTTQWWTIPSETCLCYTLLLSLSVLCFMFCVSMSAQFRSCVGSGGFVTLYAP